MRGSQYNFYLVKLYFKIKTHHKSLELEKYIVTKTIFGLILVVYYISGFEKYLFKSKCLDPTRKLVQYQSCLILEYIYARYIIDSQAITTLL